MNGDFIDSMPDPASWRTRIDGIHPRRRTGRPEEEVARLICWRVSPDASLVTGQDSTTDGGRSAQLSLP